MSNKRLLTNTLLASLLLGTPAVDAQSTTETLAAGFTVWTFGFALLAGLGFILALVLIFSKSKFSKGEGWMALLVFSFSMILNSYVLYWTHYNRTFPYLNGAWPFFTYMIGPSIYFYLKATFEDEFTRKTVARHFIPVAIMGLLLLPENLGNFGILLGLSPNFGLIGRSPNLMIAHLVFYSMQVHFLIKNDWEVDTNIKRWSGLVSKGLQAFTLAFIAYFVLVNATFFNPEWDYAISAVMAISILMIAYMSLIQQRVFRSEPIENFLPISKYKNSQLTESASQTIKKRLEQILTEEMVFKENELRLDDLAAYLNTTRHQLSQVINEQYGVSFFELINSYRVDYVKKLLQDPKYANWTILQIAFESGFNNKASFNRYFKKENGLTPSAYRMKVRG